jgi:hypothetical protein
MVTLYSASVVPSDHGGQGRTTQRQFTNLYEKDNSSTKISYNINTRNWSYYNQFQGVILLNFYTDTNYIYMQIQNTPNGRSRRCISEEAKNTHKITINPGGFTLTKMSVRGIHTKKLYVFTLESSDTTIHLKKILELIVHWSLQYDTLMRCLCQHLKGARMIMREHDQKVIYKVLTQATQMNTTLQRVLLINPSKH